MRAIVSLILLALRRQHRQAMLEQFSDNNPFTILVSTVLSARAKDVTTARISERLFKKYKTPKDFVNVPTKILEKLIYGSGYYKQKAKRIKALSKMLLEKYNGRVPQTLEQLLELPGVGRKTANCVLVYAYRIPSVPVDVHTHKVANRLGLVNTRTPEETEQALMKNVPRRYWIQLNELFVGHGQTICLTRNPKCTVCPINKFCKYYRTVFIRK